MPINADKPHLWKVDVAASVDLFNAWFLKFAPRTFIETRAKTTELVKGALKGLDNLRAITPGALKKQPAVLPTLRMSTAPPIARDRLIGLAGARPSVVFSMEDGRLPKRMAGDQLDQQLEQVCETLKRLLDRDLFPWLEQVREPTETELYRASTIIADRLTGAVADPLIRNAQEREQLAMIGKYLKAKGYVQQAPASGQDLTKMKPGTFAFRLNVPVAEGEHRVNIPIDVVIQPKKPHPSRLPILIEAKSAGDFTNTNKRRKEEAQKVHQLRSMYGKEIRFILFLRGYFDTGYLGYEAAEGLDWIWEHRIDDMLQLGI